MAAQKKILLVDDSPEVLDICAEYLADYGEASDTAQNGDEAKKLFDRNKADYKLLLTDWEYPGGGGLELIRHAREEVWDQAIVVMTGNPEKFNAAKMANPRLFHDIDVVIKGEGGKRLVNHVLDILDRLTNRIKEPTRRENGLPSGSAVTPLPPPDPKS